MGRWFITTRCFSAVLFTFLGSTPLLAEKDCPTLGRSIEAACACPEKPVLRAYRSAAARLSRLRLVKFWRRGPSVRLTDCVTGEGEEVPCHEGNGDFSDQQRTVSEGAEEPPAGCLQAIQEAKDRGCIDPEIREAEFECGSSDPAITTLPLCVDLRALANGGCPLDPLNKETEAVIHETFEDVFAPLGNTSEGTFRGDVGSSERGAERPPLTGEEEEPTEEEILSRPLPNSQIRFEIPANFFRYMMANTVFPWTLERMCPTLEQRDRTGRSKCDVRNLRIEIDPLEVLSLETYQQDRVDGDQRVRVQAERTDDGTLLRLVELSDRGMKVSWESGVLLKTERTASFDLKNEHQFQLASPGQPSGQAAAYDSFKFYYNLPDDVCRTWSEWAGAGVRTNGNYVPWATPFFCRCDDPDTSEDDFDANNYCIFDPADRAIDFPFFHMAPPNTGMEVLCGNQLTTTTPQAGTNDLANLLRTAGWLSDERINDIYDKANLYGCMGHAVAYYDRPFSHDTASVSTFVVTGRLNLPKLSAQLKTGLLKFEIPLWEQVSQKLRKRWWSWALGWFIRIVERILSGIVTILGTGLLEFSGIPERTITVDFEPVDYRIEGNLTHKLQAQPDDNTELKVYIRRLVSTPPTVHKTNLSFDLIDFAFGECSPKHLWRGPVGIIRFLIGCPLQYSSVGASIIYSPVGASITRLLASAIIEFILQLDDLLEFIVKPIVNDTVLREGSREFRHLSRDSKLVALLEQAYKTVLLKPHEILPEEMTQFEQSARYGVSQNPSDPGTEEDQRSIAIPPPLGHLCILAQRDLSPERPFTGACLITELLAGIRVKTFEESFEMRQIGTKSHYRSLVNNVPEAVAALSQARPVTYYCSLQPGDFSPPGSPTYPETAISALTDFNEVDVSQQGRPAFTQQCALFFDARFVARVTLGGNLTLQGSYRGTNFSLQTRGEESPPQIDFFTNLTERTQLLMNEVFVCEDSAHCNPRETHLTRRAKRAICSIANDIRIQVNDGREVIADFTLVDAAQLAPGILGATLEILDQTEPLIGMRARQLVNDSKTDEVLAWLKECPRLIHESPL